MIRHIVMWKLKDEAEGECKAENARRMKSRLEALKGRIPEIMGLQVGLPAPGSEESFDIVLYSLFDSLEGLERYQKHPAHLEVAEFVKKVRKEKACVDCETD